LLKAEGYWALPERIDSHDMLASELAEFYLAIIAERESRKAEAIKD